MANVLIVYGSQFGNTRRLAVAMGDAIRSDHRVRVMAADDALAVDGSDVDLLIFGSPTQIHGRRLLGRPFLEALPLGGFDGTAAAAFDTRLAGPADRTGTACDGIASKLATAGCRLVVRPESFLVDDMEGPLSIGELARATAWARGVLEATAAAPGAAPTAAVATT